MGDHMTYKIGALMLGFVMLASFSTFARGATREIEIAHMFALDDPHHVAMLSADKFLREKTNGRLGFKIYPNGTYGNQSNSIQAVRMGTLDAFNQGVQPEFYKPIGALQGPYLFTSYDHFQKVKKSDYFKKLIGTYEAGMGVKIVGVAHFGFRHAALRKEAKNAADFKGVKIRVSNFAPYPEAAVILGAIGTPLPIGDVYMAIKTGVVDGTENPLPQIYTMKFHEVTSNIILTGHMLALNTYFVSTKLWNSLSREDQDLVVEAHNLITRTVEQANERQEQEYLSKFKEAGLKVITPDTKSFVDRLPLVLQKYPEWDDIYKNIRAVN